MAQEKNKEVSKSEKISNLQITGLTMPPDLVDLIDKEADFMDRSRVAQIRVCVREWFQSKGKTVTLTGYADHPTAPPPGMKPASQVKTAPPAVQQIINEEEGWESSATVKR